jgi:DNA repair protein RadA/Sms
MSKTKKQYVCNNCGSVTVKWSGQCFDCNSWGTIEEESYSTQSTISAIKGVPIALEDFNSYTPEKMRIVTPIEELNRVLGGGLVQASAILIGGDPGIGKSTILLQLCTSLGECGIRALYVTGEESTDQVKLRASRLGLKADHSKIISATNIHDILATVEGSKSEIDLLVIDSIQTMYSSEVSSSPGTVSQIKTTAHELISYSKQNNIILVIVGHVTKDGQIAGPKVLEHMMDTVLYFEGDPSYHFRILRSIKNRFGGVNEIGVFEMTADGLKEVPNPSQIFLMDRECNVSGSSIFAGIEGSRPILVEVQALITQSNIPMPRRSVVGWDANRLSMILAVLAVRYGLNLSSYEVYLSVAGGLKVTEPAVDLAVAAAIISAAMNVPLPQSSVFFGEIGLSGEVRKVSQPDLRIKEAKKLGFTKIFCSQHPSIDEVSINPISHIKQIKSAINN